MSASRPSLRSPHRVAALLLLPPLMLTGCGAGNGGDTSAAESVESTVDEAAEPTTDAVPGMGRTAEPTTDAVPGMHRTPGPMHSEVAQPDSGLCAEIEAEPIRDLIPALEAVEPEPDYGPNSFSCELSYTGNYIQSTIAERGLDPTGYEQSYGGFGVRIIVVDPKEEEASLMGIEAPILTSDAGSQVQIVESLQYGEDYIVKDYRTLTEPNRVITISVAVFAPDLPRSDALDQAAMDTLDQIVALY